MLSDPAHSSFLQDILGKHELPQAVSVGDLVQRFRPDEPVACFHPAALFAAADHFLHGFAGETSYAVKANPHPLVLATLVDCGIHSFSISSPREAVAVRQVLPNARLLYMNPVKSRLDIEESCRSHGVRIIALDHMSELEKIGRVTALEDLLLVVRLAVDPTGSAQSSTRIGATAGEAISLLKKINSLKIQAGLSFQLGPLCPDPSAYSRALHLVEEVSRQAEVPLSLIDLGGGFPAGYPGINAPPLDEYLVAISGALAEMPLTPHVRILSEPGRALCASAFSLVTRITLRAGSRLHLNDGIYGSLRELSEGRLYLPRIKVHRDPRSPRRKTVKSQPYTLVGPTSDSRDVIHEALLPDDLQEGDWLEFQDVGAYSLATQSHYAGMGVHSLAVIGASGS